MKIYEKILENEVDFKRDATYMYGRYRGFYMQICTNNDMQAMYRIIIRVSYKNSNENFGERIAEYFNRIDSQKLKIVFKESKKFFYEVHIADTSEKKIIECANEFIPSFVDFLASENCESGCQMCGEVNYVNNYKFNDTFCSLCSNCAQKLENDLEKQNLDKKSQKSKIIPGVVGALIGALIGVAVWVVIYMLRIYCRVSWNCYGCVCNERI